MHVNRDLVGTDGCLAGLKLVRFPNANVIQGMQVRVLPPPYSLLPLQAALEPTTA